METHTCSFPRSILNERCRSSDSCTLSSSHPSQRHRTSSGQGFDIALGREQYDAHTAAGLFEILTRFPFKPDTQHTDLRVSGTTPLQRYDIISDHHHLRTQIALWLFVTGQQLTLALWTVAASEQCEAIGDIHRDRFASITQDHGGPYAG